MALKHPLAVLLFAVAGLASCNKSDRSGTEPRSWCGTPSPAPGTGPGIAPGGCIQDSTACAGAICTADFRTVTLQVTTSTGAPVTLDSFVVVDATGTPLPPVSGVKPYGPTGTPGSYAILSDAWVHGHYNQSMNVTAKGFLNGVQVVNQPATVTTDCCHVGGSPSNSTVVVAAP